MKNRKDSSYLERHDSWSFVSFKPLYGSCSSGHIQSNFAMPGPRSLANQDRGEMRHHHQHQSLVDIPTLAGRQGWSPFHSLSGAEDQQHEEKEENRRGGGQDQRDKRVWRCDGHDKDGRRLEEEEKRNKTYRPRNMDVDNTETLKKSLTPEFSTVKEQMNNVQVKHSLPLRGLLWMNRDKIFSKWKERFFILNSSFLLCFKKEPTIVSDLGCLVFKMALSSITKIDLTSSTGYLTVSVCSSRHGKILLRSTQGIRDWVLAIKTACETYKEKSMEGTEEFWSSKQQLAQSSSPSILPVLSNTGNMSSPIRQPESVNPWCMKQKLADKENKVKGYQNNDDSGHSSLGSEDARRSHLTRRHSNMRDRSQDVFY